MTRLLIALGVSVALHGLLAVGLSSGFGTTDAAREEQAPQLEVAPVDLSFADEEDATARPAQSAAAAQPLPPISSRAVPEPRLQTPVPDGLLPSPPEVSDVPPPPSPNDEPPPDVAPPVPPENEVPPVVDAASSEPAPQTAKVTVPPLPCKKIQPPKYPDIARKRGEEGTVLVEATVAANGRVLAVAVKESSGFDVLDSAACQTVRKAQFTPARVGDTPAEGHVTVPIEFRLRDAE